MTKIILIGDGPLYNHCVKKILSENQEFLLITSKKNRKHLNINKKLFTNFKFLEKIKKIKFLISIMNGKIIDKDILNKTETAINFHDGPLPKYGGLFSSTWAILNKEKKHGCCWHLMTEKIDTGNIWDVLNKGCNYEIDLFSIDIDSIDYWIIDKLKNNISKIFVAEYNPVFGSRLEVSVPNISGFDRGKYHHSHLCYGMSLKALVNLMDKKGYYFIGSNIQKINAFFISKEFKKDIFFKNIKIKSLDKYTDSNIRDSRDSNNNLNYLSDDLKFKEIENCEVINLKDNKYELIKLKDLK